MEYPSVVKRPKQFVYKLVVPALYWNCIWSWLQIRQSGVTNLELSGSSLAFHDEPDSSRLAAPDCILKFQML
jgi:hypothetical protein